MADENTYDEEVETNGELADAQQEENGESFTGMQERMQGDTDDDPWYSSSEGSVVDQNGDILIDPNTNEPFSSIEDYNRVKSEIDKQNTENSEKKEDQEQPKPFAKSFENFMTGEGNELTPERLKEMSSVGTGYKYSSELMPEIDSTTQKDATNDTTVDPVIKVKEDRRTWESVAVDPIREIRKVLIEQGADQSAVNEILSPILQKQLEHVDNLYNDAYEKALEARRDSKYGAKFNELEKEKIANTSKGNIEKLSKAYYPKNGPDAFFSLVNGHLENPDDPKSFVRGPAASVIDFLISQSNDGKKYANEEDRNASYKEAFLNITSDFKKAQALFDIAHYYWIGKKSHDGQKMVYQKGKEAASKERSRIHRTVKTKPASYSPGGGQADDMDGLPDILKAALRHNG